MAVALTEVHRSRSGATSATSATGEWLYVARVTGEANPETALIAAVLAAAPFFWYNLARKEIKFDPITSELYDVSVSYVWEIPNSAAQDPTQSPGPTDGPGGGAPSGTPAGPANENERLQANVSLSYGGRPPKLTQSIAVVTSGGLGVAAPNHGGLINLNRTTGEVEGVEIPDPMGTYKIGIQVDWITTKYIKRVVGAMWKRNHAAWRAFPAGSVALIGVNFASTANGRVQCDFDFGVMEEVTIGVGEIATELLLALPAAPVVKKGWDYLEIQYRNQFDPVSGYTVATPFAFYVHQLLKNFDMTTLGLGA